MLVNIDETKEYLKINSNTFDNVLSNIIVYSSKAIESYCGRVFLSNTYTEYFNGGVNSVYVKNIPINNVTVVAEYDGTAYINLYGPEADGSLPANASNGSLEYVWYDDTGRIEKLSQGAIIQKQLNLGNYPKFYNYPKAVKIVYNGGFDSIPDDLKMACMDLVKLIYKQEQNTDGYSFEGQSKNFPSLSGNYPKHVRRILDFYKIT